ncbi:cysteine hydrolase family protein [Streptomyces sp. NPDC096153]|uniref:cysteine hydrolase family protein n=1 Tax=Streptomyces sp. NPDC096153 TaxID=3155548 RepID=UPI003330533C
MQQEESKQKALLIIDMQEGLTRRNTTHNSKNVIANISTLIKVARSSQCAVIFVQHDGDEGEPLHPSEPGWLIDSRLQPEIGDRIFRKTSPDSFWGTTLDEFLRTRGISELFVTGMRTEVCVDTTCRRAVSLNYMVTLVSDAHTTTQESAGLDAPSIISHHNATLDDLGNSHAWIRLATTRDVKF